MKKIIICQLLLLAIFWTEITTIWKLLTSEVGRGGSHIVRFKGPSVQIRNVNV